MGGDLIIKAVIYVFVDYRESEVAWPVILTTVTRTCVVVLLFILLCFNDQSKKHFRERLTEVRRMWTNRRK